MNVHTWPDLVGLLLRAAPLLLIVVGSLWAGSGVVALARRWGRAGNAAAPVFDWPRQAGAPVHGRTSVVWTCSVCRLVTQMDDVVVATGGDRCVCLRCYTRETGTERPMPVTLQKALEAALAGATTA